MAIVIPPDAPPLSPGPVRTPLLARDNAINVKDNKPWSKFFELLYGALLYLLQKPVLLSGLDANKPDATQYPENSRYWSTDITTEFVNIYFVPGDHTSASWVSM